MNPHISQEILSQKTEKNSPEDAAQIQLLGGLSTQRECRQFASYAVVHVEIVLDSSQDEPLLAKSPTSLSHLDVYPTGAQYVEEDPGPMASRETDRLMFELVLYQWGNFHHV